MENNQGSTKKWYQRPENYTGLAILAGLTYLGVHAVPFIILAATNTLYATFLVGSLAAMVFAVLDKDIRTTAFYAWKMLTRGLTGLLINLDPIAIVETYLKQMNKRLDEMLESKDALGGQIKKLDMTISDNTARMTKDLKLAQQAEKQGDQMSKATFAMEAQQLKSSNDNLNTTRTKMELMFRVLDKMYKNTDFILKNTKMQVDVKKREREATTAAHRAMTSGWKVIKGDSEQKAMFDQAMESIADTMGRQLSEMERIMDMSGDMMNGVDLEKGVIKEDALKMLDKWEKEGNSVLLGTDKTVLISQAYDPNQVLDVDQESVPVNKKDRFAKLLK